MSFEKYQGTFPSKAVLEKQFGSEDECIQRVFEERKEILKEVGPMGLYSDVSMSAALKSGELKQVKGASDKGVIFVLDEGIFKQNFNAFAQIRRHFDREIRVKTIAAFKHQRTAAAGVYKRVCIVKDGMFSNNVASEEIPVEEDVECKICQEFIGHVKAGNINPSKVTWWEYVVEGNSVYIDPVPDAEAIRKSERKERSDALVDFEPTDFS